MASPFLREGPDLALERPGIARLLVNLPIGFGDRGGAHQPAGVEIGERRVALALLDGLRTHSVSTAASMIRCATWMPFGPSSRAVLSATARSPNLALANPA